VRVDLAAARADADRIRDEETRRESEITTLSAQLQSVRLERDALSARTSTVAAEASEVESLKRQLEASRVAASKVTEITRKLDSTTAESAAVCEARDALQHQLQDSEAERLRVNTELAMVREDLAVTTAEGDRLREMAAQDAKGGLDPIQLRGMCDSLKAKNGALDELMAIRLEEIEEQKVCCARDSDPSCCEKQMRTASIRMSALTCARAYVL
jgi:chromosome segregation ATPase